MHLRIRHCITVCIVLLVFSSCHSVPEHANYIPNDAVVVVSLDTKELGKRIAWSAITGSPLFKAMQKRAGNETATKDIENAGIDALNTFYLYIKNDKRFNNGNSVTALVPLSDAAKWETFVKKVVPNISFKQLPKRKEAKLADGMYAGWNDHLLIIMNVIPNPQDYYTNSITDSAVVTSTDHPIDEVQVSAEMENSFNISKENALTQNIRFTKLQKEANDISLWINYDQVMSQYLASGLTNMMNGISLSNILWKDGAFAAGINFQKGRISSKMLYYTSDEMKEIGKDFSEKNLDKDMLDRLPKRNLDMLFTFHLSPKGTKSILDKIGLLGFLNLTLSSQGLTVDDILGAFTGDMVATMNDFSIQKNQNVVENDPDDGNAKTTFQPNLNFLYALKINNKENFNRLLQFAISNRILKPLGNNIYHLYSNDIDNSYIEIITDNNYIVFSNKAENATAFIANSNKGQKIPDIANKEVYGHPLGIYLDMQALMQAVNPSMNLGKGDSLTMVESKKLLQNITFNGGKYSNNAFEYHMNINFMNKSENSLIQILDMVMRINDESKKTVVAR
ncbi:MAG: DUF4836 family protein [Bacteroidota bacterium]